MIKKDALHPFIFEQTDIRGNLAHLNQSYTDALAHQDLPLVIKLALGELMVASALLTATLKMNGAMVLQIQTSGQLKLLVVECTSKLELRATAKWQGDIADDARFIDLIKNGQCVITLDPDDSEPYQGIVPIEGETIAEMLEGYMIRSQQIETKLWLTCDGEAAAGMMLQKLPGDKTEDTDAWNRVGILGNTVKQAELQQLSVQSLIKALFNEEDVRLFDEKSIQFYCKCSRDGVASMLKMLGKAEIEEMLAEQTVIDVNCDYCNAKYSFDAIDSAALFSSDQQQDANQSIH